MQGEEYLWKDTCICFRQREFDDISSGIACENEKCGWFPHVQKSSSLWRCGTWSSERSEGFFEIIQGREKESQEITSMAQEHESKILVAIQSRSTYVFLRVVYRFLHVW